MHKQVGKNHYVYGSYSHKGRWVSYFHQVNEVLGLKPHSILEVGVGDKVFGSYIQNNTDIDYKSLDIADDLGADIIGSVDAMLVPDSAFDVVCAFEVLEHLPFERFEISLKELARVSKKYVVISLPHFGPPVQLYLKLPFLKPLKIAFKLPYYKKHEFNGEHYWEIGKKGYPLTRILGIMNKQFIVRKEFVPFESQYHHFFVLEVR